jgi:hypothetical protein
MSTPTRDLGQNVEAPSFEPWLRVALAAFVPSLAAFFLPSALHLPAFVVAGLMVVVALGMLVVQERRYRTK